MPTTWEERVKPTTSWDGRLKPQTDWEDAYTEVADEEDQVIFILANEWKMIPATFWKARPVI